MTKIQSRYEYDLYMNQLIKKYISFVYYGCLGIKEIIMDKYTPRVENSIRNISFHYGLLIYLKEELVMLKNNKSFEYFTKIEEFLNLFLYFSEGLTKYALSQIEYLKKLIKELVSDKNCLKKYEVLALSVCSHIFQEIDRINEEDGNLNSENIRNHIRGLFQDIQYLASV